MASERPTPAPNEGTPSKERREIPAFSRQDALQARLVNPGENYSFINPANREVPALTAEVINPKATDSLIQQRSDEERRDTARGTVDAWKQTMITKFADKNTLRFFQESEKGKRFASVFRESLGIDVTNLTEEKVTKLYNDFCATEEGKNGAIAYADKILESYSNKSLKELEDNLDAFTWMGNILGEKTAQVLAQRISMIKRSDNEEEKNTFVTAASNENRINKPTDSEVVLLDFLYKGGKDLPTKPSATLQPTPTPASTPSNPEPSVTPATPPAETPRPDEPSPTTNHPSESAQGEASAQVTNPDIRNADNEPLQPEIADEVYLNEKLIDPDIRNPHNLADILRKLRYKQVDPNRIGSWYIPNPPADLGTLREDEIRRVIPATQQRFINQNGHTNDEAIPHVWDLMVPLELKKEDGLDTKYPNPPVNRFTEAANRLTEDDSSLIALSSVASADEEKQAQVYRDIAQILVETFRYYDIYGDWVRTQNHEREGGTMNSLDYYLSEDQKWVEENGNDERYRALPLNAEGRLDLSSTAWSTRCNELDQAIRNNQFTLYQHRWLETMSKAVDIHKVMDLIKSKQTAAV